MRASFLAGWPFILWLGVVFAAFALGCMVGSRCLWGIPGGAPFHDRHQERTLVSILDEADFASFEIEDESFNDSCFIIEAMIREKLPETDVTDGRSIASNLRVLVATYRKGSKSINCPPGSSVRQVLQAFVSAWNVTAFLDGNIVVFGEAFDQAHFKHEAKITE